MSVLPEGASFAELVQECFFAFRGQGLMLSPLDAQLVTQWAALGVPFEVVARGIRKAAERAAHDARPGEPSLKSLRACRREVEREISHHQARAAGKGSEAKAKRTPWQAWVGERAELLARAQEALVRIDLTAADASDRACAALLRALPYSERLLLLRAARERAGAFAMSARARRLARRFHRAETLREHLARPSGDLTR
jgi:hypothetical protein